mmetsp:Transcript_16267/g.37469  ORF Transcript_16267/g.37469 Transcript_16267/m.37469 type:complete len:93 (-) Transcript_16267:845-1123(-)
MLSSRKEVIGGLSNMQLMVAILQQTSLLCVVQSFGENVKEHMKRTEKNSEKDLTTFQQNHLRHSHYCIHSIPSILFFNMPVDPGGKELQWNT